MTGKSTVALRAAALAGALMLAAPISVALADNHGSKTAMSAQDQAALGTALDAALAGAHRSEANKARDKYRHPKETLMFFGLTPDMTVVEIAPGGGWYTEVLAPVLRDKGKLIAATSGPNGRRAELAGLLTKFEANKEIYDKVEISNYAPSEYTIGVAPETADMVLVFRHMHGVIGFGLAPKAIPLYYAALKPGGKLGIVQHRLPEDREDTGKMVGWVKESKVIALMENAGFRLVGKSEINANPKDTADYEKGVWTLPPFSRGGPEYDAIGESDRMTLLFEKPAK